MPSRDHPVAEPRQIDKNEFVIYYDKPPESGSPTVRIDKFTLIAALPSIGVGGAAARGKTAEAIEVIANVGTIAETLKPDSGQAGGQGPSSTTSVSQCVQSRICLDIKNAKDFKEHTVERLDSPSNPLTDKVTRETVKLDGRTETTITTEYPGWLSKLLGWFGGGDYKESKTTVVHDPPAPERTPVKVVQEDSAPKQGGELGGGAQGGGQKHAGGHDQADADGGQDADEATSVDDGDGQRTTHPPDAGKDALKTVPVEPGWVDGKLGASFTGVMTEFASMDFATQEGAQAYLDSAMERLGVGIETDTTGQTLTDAGPQDPMGVAKRLQEAGVRDTALINQVVEEANGAVALFEALVRQCQADLNNLDLTAPDYSKNLNTKIADWDQLLHTRLSVDPPPGTATPGLVSFDVQDGITAALPAGSARATPNVSPLGLSIRAGVGAVSIGEGGSTRPLGSIEPGYEFQATPIVSVFSDEAWQFKA